MNPRPPNVARPRPKAGELVAITRDVPAAAAKKGQTGTVVSATDDEVVVRLDGQPGETTATATVPRDAIFRVRRELDRAEARSAEATATKVRWLRFSWGGLIAVIVMAILTMVIPALRLMRKGDSIGKPGGGPGPAVRQPGASGR